MTRATLGCARGEDALRALLSRRPSPARRRERLSHVRNQEDAISPVIDSSMRNFWDHATTGRQRSWSSSKIIRIIATTARAIAAESPRATATLM